MSIPKKIHYCWFGNNPKPDIVLNCIESWKKYLPDFEIVEWNESNYDYLKIDYTKEAYEAKKWAFVSDYARFDILSQHGGIYLDTDVEFLQPLPNSYLENEAFTAMESTGMVSPGLIYATIPNTEFLGNIIKKYQSMHFIVDEQVNYTTVNTIITDVLKSKGYIVENKYQKIDNIVIFPSEIFCGYDLDVMEYDIQRETISVHHYAGTWTNKSLKRKLQKYLKKFVGVGNYRKLLTIVRKIRKIL